MIHIRKPSRSLRLPERVTLAVTLVTFTCLLFVCSLILLVAFGAPLGRLLGILGIWLVEVQLIITGAVWAGSNLFGLLLTGSGAVLRYSWSRPKTAARFQQTALG